MSIILITLGVGCLIAAIVGGGVEFGNIHIPQIASRHKRIAIFILGVLLLCVGLYAGGLFDPPPGPADDPPPGPADDPPVAVMTLVGRVALSHHAADFRRTFSYYSIRASAGPRQEFDADLNCQGQFQILGIPKVPQHDVSWSVSQPDEFVIWPLVHPQVSPGEELHGFRFRRLSDVFGNEKRRMIEAVTTGKFSEANERLSTLRQLFGRLGDGRPSNDSLAVRILRWRFTIHRDLAHAAHNYRTAVGRSKITDCQVMTERQWRRAMIGAALDQPASGQRGRDLVRAANAWSAYAREVFSWKQRSWPDRSLSDCETSGGVQCLENRSYAEPLREDIKLIKDKLETRQIQVMVNEDANNQDQLASLKKEQRLAVKSFSSLLKQDPDRVSLNQFANLLNALQGLVAPSE